ncbi:hypothetical protein [Vogesella indigofera]|uniref:hypothetical protein n=1 Tax=Vogesella indigofera TaxID=45465 RepID=UPI00234E480F|nr:hypothetical protein [Vogesella indigofera]MDC7698821.1 hypothetical protein [Vogesella indigofera]
MMKIKDLTSVADFGYNVRFFPLAGQVLPVAANLDTVAARRQRLAVLLSRRAFHDLSDDL